jgi:hypothetical protein
MTKTMLAIDVGEKGSAAVFHGAQLIKVMSFYHDPDWRKTLYWWCLVDKPDLCVIENVHAWRGQGVTSMFTFGWHDGSADTIAHVLDLPLRKVEPEWWQNRLALPKHREILDDAKRKAARRKSQKEHCLKWYPELEVWNQPMLVPSTGKKTTPDLWASPLIGRAVILDLTEGPLGHATVTDAVAFPSAIQP